GGADKNDPLSALDHEDTPQNQCAHDLFAKIGFTDHQGAEFVGPQQHRFNIFDDMRVYHCGLARELGDIRGELAALRIGVNKPFVAEAVTTDYPDFARQQDEHSRAEASRTIEQLAFGVAGQAAEATHPVDFSLREDRKHLMVTRMVAHARVFDDRAVVDTAPI